MSKLILIHTAPDIIASLNSALQKKSAESQIVNLMDDQLSLLLATDQNAALERLNSLLTFALEREDMESTQVITTCTALSALADRCTPPIAMLDGQMHQSLAEYKSILLVATSQGALVPTRDGILRYAKEKPVINGLFVEGAREAAKNGNIELHDRMIAQALIGTPELNSSDIIVLCQPSMSHLREEIKLLSNLEVKTGIDCFIEAYTQG